MYFIINENYQIHDVCCEKHEIYKMILDTLQNLVAVPASQTNDWQKVTKEGYWYFRSDNEIELRKYTLVSGFLGDYLEYSHAGRFYITDFSSPEVNIFVQQLKEEIKARYVRENAKGTTFADIKKKAQRDAKGK